MPSGFCHPGIHYGYEAVESMIYYEQAGPFAEGVEESVAGACHRLLGKWEVNLQGAQDDGESLSPR